MNQSEPSTGYPVSADQLGRVNPISIPWWLQYSVGIPCFWWRAVRHEGFANQILPHILFIIAIGLVCLKSLGIDAAGLVGMLPESADPVSRHRYS